MKNLIKKIAISAKKKHKVLLKFLEGFTLIELLVVVAIIGILASVVMGSLFSARQKARDAKRKLEIKQIDTAINLYMSNNNGLPPDLGDPNCVDLYTSDITCIASLQSSPIKWGILGTQLSPYITNLPTDPCTVCVTGSTTFEYVYHAPAGITAILNPATPDFTLGIYSIYALSLENNLTSFGYGQSVPASSGGGATPANLPTVDVTASPNPTAIGNSTISWTSTDATSCTATNGSAGWSGVRATSGSFSVVGLSGLDITYTLACTGSGGSTTDFVILDVPRTVYAAP